MRLSVEVKDLQPGDIVVTNDSYFRNPYVVQSVTEQANGWYHVVYESGSFTNLKGYWFEDIER